MEEIDNNLFSCRLYYYYLSGWGQQILQLPEAIIPEAVEYYKNAEHYITSNRIIEKAITIV